MASEKEHKHKYVPFKYDIKSKSYKNPYRVFDTEYGMVLSELICTRCGKIMSVLDMERDEDD